MRKFTSLLLTFTLLAVSSLPAVAQGATCAIPAHLLAQQQMDGEGTMAGTSHLHTPSFQGDWQTCRIECGCGCHSSMDTLPHLLAPSTPSSSPLATMIFSIYVADIPIPLLHARFLSLVTPPPITS